MKIKNTFYCLLFCFCFSPSIYSQAEIASQECNSITATIKTFSSKKSSSEFNFVLEKEILKDVWQKIATETKKSNTCDFKNLNSGTYRVSIIPNMENKNVKTKIHLFGSKKASLANLYVSNSLKIKVPCDENQTEHRIDEIALFPNPTHSEISIFFPFEGGGVVEIYNTASQLVRKNNVKELNNTIDISQLESGVHYAKVFYLGKYLCARKFLIIK